MPGSCHACLMQDVLPNNNSFQIKVKENTPHSRKKKKSPRKDHLVGKREK